MFARITNLAHDLLGVTHFHQSDSQFFQRKTWKVSCLPACLNSIDSIGLKSIHSDVKIWELDPGDTNMSSQPMEKRDSNVTAQSNSQNSPISVEYEKAMEALSSLINSQKRGEKHHSPGTGGKYKKLERMSMYVKILGLEEHIAGLKIIHVAGTKGKGSTCAFCEAILRESGFRTGLFISPHLIDVRERFRVNGLDISEERFLLHFWECWNCLRENVTEDLPMPPLFQFLTVLALKIFVCEKVDVAIVEVGLGGKKDSTNVIKKPVVCGIASLGMDHMEILGDTLREIASHKAGILKPHIHAFSSPQVAEAMEVLQDRACELGVPLEVAAPLDYKRLNGLKLSLSGDHQFINAGLAISLCKCWLQVTGNWKTLSENDNEKYVLPEAFLRGLSTARLSGRAQIVDDSSFETCKSEGNEISYGNLMFYLDGAHSPERKRRIHSNERKGNKTTKQILLFNCMDSRDPQVLLSRLVNICASSGSHFSKAIFIPNLSIYNKVTSGASIIPMDIRARDLSWQLHLQRMWEKIVNGKDVMLDGKSKMASAENLPSHEFLIESASCHSPEDGFFRRSAVISSLPLSIKWLRDCARENPSLKIQVLVTGSLHLVGDVLKLLRR
ncbi:Folylpolyglutamate synthase [Heracleum sosnowskyi]|uniref:Folylpolyglutamate synthase n=1 Tax=Heracleum sosnowskyi TaxID=360622 RepID=A0AAD8MAX8_9APIA|nr:Folylpolyglutamate synthase [Heracleum sosnowskyi]